MLRNEKGFTLIELVVVIILVGILSYVTLINFSDSSSSIKEQTLATKIVTDIRYAQEMALSHQRDVKCVIEPAKNCYSLKWGDDTYLQTSMGGHDFIVDFDDSDFSGVNLSGTKFTAGLLSFNSKGQPLNNGSLLTTETALLSLNDNVVIMVIPGTGRCYIQE